MFKDTYRHMNHRITPSDSLLHRTLAATQPRRRSFAPRRALAFALAMMLCLGIGTSALAASSPEFNGWLYTISPDWAMYFRPVQMSCEDQRLRLEVQGIRLDNQQAEIYVTLQDLTGDRLDESIDLFDSYGLDTPGGSSAYCQMTSYDATSRTATFYIFYESDAPIRSDKLTFSLRRLLTKKKTTTNTLDIKLAPLSSDPETHLPGNRIRGWGGDGTADAQTIRATPLLVSGESTASLAPGVSLTGAAFVDGKLHVQMLYADILRTDNHGFLWLEDAQGNRLESAASISWWADNKTDSYEEYIFNLTPEQAQGWTLQGEFITCQALIEGDWAITFPITDM